MIGEPKIGDFKIEALAGGLASFNKGKYFIIQEHSTISWWVGARKKKLQCISIVRILERIDNIAFRITMITVQNDPIFYIHNRDKNFQYTLQ